MTKEEFINDITYLGIAYNKEFSKQEIEVWYDFLKEYSNSVLVGAIKDIVKTSKYPPKINEMIEKCNSLKKSKTVYIADYMKSRGYFKYDDYGSELPIEQQEINYDKTIKFIEEENIPRWLADDINKYVSELRQLSLEKKEGNMIGCKDE